MVSDEAPTTLPPEIWYQDPVLKRRHDQSNVAQVLRFRLTSQTFRDMSWRALAEILGATTFDLHSMTSISDLEAMSSSVELNPWISKINITCSPLRRLSKDMLVYSRFYTQYKRHVLGGAFAEIKEEDKLLNSWPLLLTATPATSQLQSHDLRCKALQQTLAHCLSRMKNMESASFIYNAYKAPKRYQDILSRRTFLLLYENCPSHHIDAWNRHAQKGQEIFLQAIAASHIRPRSLQLAVKLTGLHSFVIGTSEATFSCVCRNVQKLSLSECLSSSGAWWGDSSTKPEIYLAENVFHELHSLKVSTTRGLLGTHPLSAASCPIALSTLTVATDSLPNANLFRFFTDKVQHLELSFQHKPKQEGFQAIAALRLKTLTLVWLTKDCSESSISTGGGWSFLLASWTGIPLLSAAETVIIRPEIFSQRYEQHQISQEVE